MPQILIFDKKNRDYPLESGERCKGVHCVDLGESFHRNVYLQKLASIQPRTSLVKFTRSPCTDCPGERGGRGEVRGRSRAGAVRERAPARASLRQGAFGWPESNGGGGTPLRREGRVRRRRGGLCLF